MKKGDRVYISEQYEKEYVRQYGWSEYTNGTQTIPKGTILYHVSYYDKLPGFAPITTCFSLEEPCLGFGYVYIAIPTEDIEVEIVDENEVRICLNESTPIEIYYVGTMILDRKKVITNKHGHNIKFHTKFRFAKQFKQLEKELQDIFDDKFYRTLDSHLAIPHGYRLVIDGQVATPPSGGVIRRRVVTTPPQT